MVFVIIYYWLCGFLQHALLFIAPAMDEDMWRHPVNKKNIETLEQTGTRILPVNNGELASGLQGEGRMAEPEEIINYLRDFFFETKHFKRHESIDNRRPYS